MIYLLSVKKKYQKNGFKKWTPEQKEQFRNKIKNQIRNSSSQARNTKIEKFKKTWHSKTKEELDLIKKHWKESMNNRSKEEKKLSLDKFRKTYHQNWITKSKELKQSYVDKMHESKRKNKTFNTSKIELKIKDILKKKFKNNLFFHYKSDSYPFVCDFYILNLDLYIELNFHWTHGGHAFDETNSEDLKVLEVWKEKAKTSDFYKSAINVWTMRDVKKLNTFKKNNLNYKIFYNKKEFDKWFACL